MPQWLTACDRLLQRRNANSLVIPAFSPNYTIAYRSLSFVNQGSAEASLTGRCVIAKTEFFLALCSQAFINMRSVRARITVYADDKQFDK
jgi:hypothetical protein